MLLSMRDRKANTMKIKKITVSGFRNVTKTTISLDNPMTYLISPNNVGKSNAFKAIDFASLVLQTKKPINGVLDNASLNKNNLKEDYYFEIEFVSPIIKDGQKKDVRFRYSFLINWGTDNPVFEKENLIGYDSQRPTVYFRREGTSVSYKTSETGRADTNLSVEPNALCVWKLEAYDSLFYVDAVKAITNFDVLTVHGLAGSPIPGIIGLSIPHADLNFESMNNSTAKPVWELKTKDSPKYEKLKNAMRHLFPDFIDFIPNKNVPVGKGEIEVSDKDITYSLFVQFESMTKAISVSKTSDGFRGILSTLVSLSLEAGPETIICIEEPENYINPGLLKVYIQILSSFIGDAKALVASHSPFIANYADPKQIYVSIPDDKHLAIFSSFTDQGAKRIATTSEKAKMPIGEFIFELLCGDAGDVELLKKSMKVDK